MQPNLAHILTKVLDIIDYQNDKQQFVEKFSQLCIEKTFVAALETLTDEQKQAVAEAIAKEDKELATTKFQEYLGKEKYLEILDTTIEDTFAEYLQSLSSTLSEEQKSEIEEYLLSLENASHANS